MKKIHALAWIFLLRGQNTLAKRSVFMLGSKGMMSAVASFNL